MPPIPINGAPTEGNVALVYWGIAALAILVFAFRYYMPSGKQRLDYRQSKETSAIQVLQDQIDLLQEEVKGLRREVRSMAKNEEYNREYRHMLANRAQALTFANDSSVELLHEIKEGCEIPMHFERRVDSARRSADILANYPEPEPRPHDPNI